MWSVGITLESLLLFCFVDVAVAQSIVVDGQKIDATRQNVAPAGEEVSSTQSGIFEEEDFQLTDTVLTNLTSLSLTGVSSLHFDDDTGNGKQIPWRCKTFPGDDDWPKPDTWRMLDIVTNGALIKTIPIGASCYDNYGVYDSSRCEYVTEQFSNSSLHMKDPSSVMAPIYQGLTCQPTTDRSDECSLGGFPSYVVDAANVADVQIAVNFARELNLRLVIKNTGHDFNGRSLGAGALSIWTHRFKGIKFYDRYQTSLYDGPAMKVGAGVVGQELYAAAEKYNVTAVGGECLSVGWGGGYIAGGGHSPMSPKHGMAADAILSIDVVTPDGRFITANKKEHTDLFWAMSGGGGSTFGVAISYTIKAYPKTKASIMSFSFGTSPSLSHEVFWEAVKAYLELVPEFNEIGNYEYWNIVHGDGDDLVFNMVPWFAPGFTLKQLREATAPLFARWKNLGIDIKPEASEHDSYFKAWEAGFPREPIGGTMTKSAGRLFPHENLKDATKFNATFDALKGLVDKGGSLIVFGISSGPGPYPDNAVNPAWRNAALFCISIITWPEGSSQKTMARESRKLTEEWMKPWRDAAPYSGTYASESDVTEPNFQQSFYGDKYDRLLKIKDQIDPRGLFYALQAVGSERWYVTDQLEGFPTQNGRLCPVE